MYKIVHCHKDCSKCKHLSRRIDNYGYPLDYKCLKFNDSVFEDIFTCTKTFNILISISKSEAIENHRKLWNWIANRNKECIDAQTKPIDKNNILQKMRYHRVFDPNGIVIFVTMLSIKLKAMQTIDVNFVLLIGQIEVHLMLVNV